MRAVEIDTTVGEECLCICLDLLEAFLDSKLQVGPCLLHAARELVYTGILVYWLPLHCTAQSSVATTKLRGWEPVAQCADLIWLNLQPKAVDRGLGYHKTNETVRVPEGHAVMSVASI